MPSKELEKLEAKIALVVEELRRLQEENKTYLAEIKTLRNGKRSLEAELDKFQGHALSLAQLESSNQKMEDEKAYLQSKMKNILSDLDKLEFL